MSRKDRKRDDQERLLDAALEFLKDAPEDEFNQLLEESGDDPVELQKRAHGAFDAALERYAQSKPGVALSAHPSDASAVADPLEAMTVAQLRDAAAALGVRRQVLAALREHRVIVESVPRRLLARLASMANTTAEELTKALQVPRALSAARSYKSDAVPQGGGPVTFEQLLKEAGHSEAERAALMSEAE